MPPDQSLADLVTLVEWRDPAHHRAQCGRLEHAHLVSVASRLNGRVEPGVRADLQALPDPAYMAILGGADTFFATHFGPAQELDRAISRWTAVERAVVGEPTTLDGVTRSAACDRHVVATEGRVVAIDPLPRLSATRLALDFESELASRFRTRFPRRRLTAPSADEREQTTAKLVESMRLLGGCAELAAHLVGQMVSVICCRTAIDDDAFYTASDETTLGVVHLMNTHLPRKAAASVASELVHEAIHQALFRYELATPLFDEPGLALEKVTSPWTGAELELYAFLHACFVWYGVVNLWRLPTAPRLAPVARQLAIAEAGFARGPLAVLGRHASRLPSAVGAAIERMTSAVA